MTYFTLAVREGNAFFPDFGDYDREAVEYELETYLQDYKRGELAIVRSSDSQSDINAAVSRLNARCT